MPEDKKETAPATPERSDGGQGKKEEAKEEKVEEKKETPVVEQSSLQGKVKEEKKEPSGKFKDLIKKIEELSVLELADLVKELEERFGVSAAAPMTMTAVGASGGAAPVAEEKSSFTVHLVDSGAQKIAVIKAVRVILPDLGLKEAKDLVDAAPKDIKKDVPKAEAEKAKTDLEAAGAKVELK